MTEPAAPAPSTPPVAWAPSGPTAGRFMDFLNFRWLVTPAIIKVVYAVGAALISLAAILSAFGPNGFGTFLLILFVGNLMWRIYAELVMLFFGMHESLRSIERQGRR
jgi:hypothetical protein